MRQVNEAAAAATAAAAAEAPAPTAAPMPAPAPAPAAVGAAGDLAAGEANEQLRAENEALRRQMEAENEALRQQMEARQPNSYSQSYWRIRFVFFRSPSRVCEQSRATKKANVAGTQTMRADAAAAVAAADSKAIAGEADSTKSEDGSSTALAVPIKSAAAEAAFWEAAKKKMELKRQEAREKLEKAKAEFKRGAEVR